MTGASAPETSRTQDIIQIGSSSTGSSSRIGGLSDSVQISSLSGAIAAASNSLDTVQSSRISQLQRLYQSGQYQVDSAAVSRAMVSEALQFSGVEG